MKFIASFTVFYVLTFHFVLSQVNITTFKVDNAHTSVNPKETILNPSNINATSFGLLYNQSVDGQVYASPLYLSNVTIPNKGIHNVVYIATEHDSVYAFDADSNTGTSSTPLWQVSFLKTTTSGGVSTVISPVSPSVNEANTSDITVEIGITSTPVIDPSAGTLYVLSKSKTTVGSNAPTFQQYLHALDVTTGAEKFGGPVLVNPSFAGTGDGSVNGVIPFQPLRQNNRASLVLQDGLVYITFASHSDRTPYHGLILAYDEKTLSLVKSFNTSLNGSEAGIWNGGTGPSFDPSGNLFVTTGNGTFDQQTSVSTSIANWGDCFLRFSTTNDLKVVDFFSPSNNDQINSTDADLGSSSVLLLPDQAGPSPHLLLSGGKNGVLYLLNRDNLGGFSSTSNNVVQQIAEGGRYFTSFAFFNGNLYYARENSALESRTVGWDGTQYISTSPTSRSANITFSNHGSGAFISANGTQNGLVWIINHALPSQLYAFDAKDVTNPLFTFSTIFNNAGTLINEASAKFSAPVVVNGKVYFTASSNNATNTQSYGHLYVMGSLAEVASAPSTPGSLTAIASSSSQVTLDWISTSTNQSGFKIERAAQPNGPFTQVGLANANVTSYVDNNLTPLTTYYYQVLATNAKGDSPPSNMAQVATFSLFRPTNIVAYWNFDEGTGNIAHDITGQGNDGAFSGETGWIGGFIGLSALNFHGTGNAVANVTVPDSPNLRFTVHQSFTLSAWIQAGAQRSQDQGVIAKSRDQGNYYGIWINTNNQWVFRGSVGDVVGPTTTANWTHVAAVQDGAAGKRYLYINGVLAATGAAQAADGPGDLWFGQAKSVTQPFPGNLDEVRLYNRALSSTEISTLMGPPILQQLSLQTQGAAGNLGYVLPLDGSMAVESRQGSIPGNYQLQLSFSSPVSGISSNLSLQAGESGTASGNIGSVTTDSSGRVVTINLTGVGNAQRLNLHLTGIQPGNGTADVPFNVLAGDVPGDGIVSQEDATTIQNNFANVSGDNNALYDINCDGVIDAKDVTLIKKNFGSHLGSLTPYWSDEDIGNVGPKGKADYSNGTFTLTGSGADIWNQADGFHFAYQNLTGDGTIIARLSSQDSSAQDKSGIMIRESLEANARYVNLAIHHGFGAKFEYRSSPGASAVNTMSQSNIVAPEWLKLTRLGSTFTGYLSADGITWTQAASINLSMANSIYIGLGETAHNNTVLATASFDSVSVVPSPIWLSQDIGNVAIKGSSIYNSGVFNLSASGIDIWGTSDQFRYTYQLLSGNQTITARVAQLNGADPWTKCGLMIRQSLDSTSAHASIVVTPNNGVAFQHRLTPGVNSLNDNSGGKQAPYWVRLSRVGNTLTGSYSSDGMTWTAFKSDTVKMADPVYVGLALCSHNANQASTAQIDNLSVGSTANSTPLVLTHP